MCVQALPFFTFLGAEFFPKLITSTTNVRFLPCVLSVDGPVFSPPTSCTGHLKLRSTLKNICCSRGTYVHRTDIVTGFALFSWAGLLEQMARCSAASLLPSVHTRHLSIRGSTWFPPVCVYLCPRACQTSRSASLFPSFLRPPARLPDGAALGSIAALTGDTKPVCCSRFGTSNNPSLSVLWYLIMGSGTKPRHFCFAERRH